MYTDLQNVIPDIPTSIEENEAAKIEHKVLVIDDNPTNLGLLSNYLKSTGYKVLSARDGESGLEKAQTLQPDIILLDIMLPGIDGFTACRHLKENPDTQDIPVIFMTALSDAKDKLQGFQVGGVDYVTKPLQYEEVIARVGTHLNIRNLTRNLQTQNNHLQATMSELQAVNQTLSKRNIQLEASSEVGQELTAILNVDELLNKVVSLIQTKFNYYFVSIWLLDTNKDVVELRTGIGLAKVRQDIRLDLDDDNIALIWVCKQGEPRLIENLPLEEADSPLNLSVAKSELVLPLRTGEQVIGVLDILSQDFDTFDNDDQVVLQTLADQTATALRNAQLYEAEAQRRRLAESLERVGRILSSDLDLRQVPRRILDELGGVVPYLRGSVFLQVGSELQCIAKRGYPSKKSTGQLQITIDEGGVFQRMTEVGQSVLIDDVIRDEGWQQLDWLPLHHSWLGVPLISKDRVIGMISLTRLKANAFSDEDMHSVQAFASQAAIALENAGLFDEINQFNEQLEQMVTERTEELEQAYQRLARLDKTKTDFINVTSHELRTPLSVIKGYTQILKMLPVNDDVEIEKLVIGIIQGVDRLHQIVDTMLDVVKIDSEVLQVRREPTNLAVMIRDIKYKLRDALEQRQQILTIVDLDELPPIETNPELMFKVFYNLIVNSIKYTPDGGSITLSGQLVEQVGEASQVEIVVSDTGIGIDAEHHEQIFEKFYQTGEIAFHSTGQTKFKGGGPGLGLAIVRGIVTVHNGQVWVESEGHDEEKFPGSHFHVRLPIIQPIL